MKTMSQVKTLMTSGMPWFVAVKKGGLQDIHIYDKIYIFQNSTLLIKYCKTSHVIHVEYTLSRNGREIEMPLPKL